MLRKSRTPAPSVLLVSPASCANPTPQLCSKLRLAAVSLLAGYDSSLLVTMQRSAISSGERPSFLQHFPALAADARRERRKRERKVVHAAGKLGLMVVQDKAALIVEVLIDIAVLKRRDLLCLEACAKQQADPDIIRVTEMLKHERHDLLHLVARKHVCGYRGLLKPLGIPRHRVRLTVQRKGIRDLLIFAALRDVCHQEISLADLIVPRLSELLTKLADLPLRDLRARNRRKTFSDMAEEIQPILLPPVIMGASRLRVFCTVHIDDFGKRRACSIGMYAPEAFPVPTNLVCSICAFSAISRLTSLGSVLFRVMRRRAGTSFPSPPFICKTESCESRRETVPHRGYGAVFSCLHRV